MTVDVAEVSTCSQTVKYPENVVLKAVFPLKCPEIVVLSATFRGSMPGNVVIRYTIVLSWLLGCAGCTTSLIASRSSSSRSSSGKRQEELLAQKTALQIAGKTEIVARLMVEELAFYGIRNTQDVATCLNGYDQTAYPEGSPWSFTRFYIPQAFDAGYRLTSDAGEHGERSRRHTIRRACQAASKSRWNR